MKEPYIEGVATRDGREPCVDDPEGRGEASVAVRAGQPSSREISFSGVPTLSEQAEGHIADGAIASRQGTPRGQT